MNILVTGASGFIGTNLCPYMSQRHKVVGIDHHTPQMGPGLWKYEPCDLLDDNMVAEFFRDSLKFDCIVHLAGKGGVRSSLLDPVEYVDANVRTTASLLGYCGQGTRFILASSSSVYGNLAAALDGQVGCPEHFPRAPKSPYAATKCAAEDLVHSWWINHRSKGFSAIALRFFTCYGPWNRPDMAMMKWADCIRRGEELRLFGRRDMKRDWTPVSDICSGIMAACEHEHGGYEILNLGTGNPVNVEQMMRWLHQKMIAPSKSPDIVDVGRQPGDVRVTHADISKAKEMLGWEPKAGHKKGIQEFVAWYDAMERDGHLCS